VSCAELEPFYDKAEHEIGVSGRAGNLQGKKIDGGNPFEAPRQRDYPLPPLEMDQSGILFEAGTRKLGYHPFSTPRAILSQPITAARAAPIAASASRSAAMSAPSRASSSPSCRRPMRQETSS
jgi:choline dehydrogenase-like flavoprotein